MKTFIMPANRKKIALVASAAVLAMAVWLGVHGLYGFEPVTSASAQPAAPQAPEGSLSGSLIKLQTVAEASVRQSVVINGKLALNANRIHQVSARVSGRVDRLQFVEGERVQSGQPVAWLYSPEYISAQNEFLLALSTLKTIRQSPSSADWATDAAATLEGARQKLSVLGASEADIQALERTGKVQPHLLVRSGISGRVIKRNVDPGGYLDVGGALGTVADLSSLWFIGYVFDSDLPRIRQGQPVRISINGVNTPAPLSGVLSFISPTVDANTHSVWVRVELPNTGDQLKPEMFGRAEITLANQMFPVIPRQAVVQDGAESFVMVQRGGSPQKPNYVRTPVKLIPTDDPGQWAVSEGLKAGEQVVIEGSVLVEREVSLTPLAHGGAKP